ncbi:MAG: hypothetical protein ABSF67_04380 [Roseiarcus sp.]|jgi:hypothetical protein
MPKDKSEAADAPEATDGAQKSDATIEVAAAEIATKKQHQNVSYILARAIDARSPFPLLSLFKLAALPRKGDLLNVQVSTGSVVGYRVEWVNFNPYVEYQITIGCLPPDVPSVPSETTKPAIDDLKERMDNVVKAQLQVFERGQAFSNAMILAGYAGIFGLWSLSKDTLTNNTIDTVAVLVGLSIVIYVTWELYAMILRANSHFRFQKLIGKQPAEFFKLAIDYDSEQQLIGARVAVHWRFAVIPSIILAYAGALILLYNFAANLLGFHLWP